MERKLVLNAQLAIAHGHHLEVTEHVDESTGEAMLHSVVDLATGIRYRRVEEPRGEIVRWRGQVIDCTVTIGNYGAHTTLTVDVAGDGDADSDDSATGVNAALHGADAAATAAKAEADRWGGVDRPPEPEAERFW